MSDYVRAQLRLPKPLKEWAHAYAESKGTNFSKLVIQLLTNLREEEQREQAPQEAEQI